MNDQLHTGKGFLKDKLEGYQVDPPESVWNSISASLGGRNRRGLYVIILAGAASVALAISLGIQFFGSDIPERMPLSERPRELNSQPVTPQERLKPQEPVSLSQPKAAHSSALMAESREEALREKVNRSLVQLEQEESQDLSSDKPGISAVYTSHESENVMDSQVSEEAGLQAPEVIPDSSIQLTIDAGDDLPTDQAFTFDQKKKRDPRWMLGAVLSPLYSYRDADLQAMSGGAEYESGLVSYAGGINVSYRGNSRLAIETGIHFNKMGLSIGAPGIQLISESFEIAPTREASSQPEMIAITNSVGNIVTKSGQVIVNAYKLNSEYGADALSNSDVSYIAQSAEHGIEQHLDYLEVPFNVRYTLVDKTFELQLVGGMSTNFLVNNYITTETAAGKSEIGYLTNIRSVNYSGNAGIGMIYHLHERFSLLLEPRFRYFLNSVNDASLPSTRPYALGFYTGISFTF